MHAADIHRHLTMRSNEQLRSQPCCDFYLDFLPERASWKLYCHTMHSVHVLQWTV